MNLSRRVEALERNRPPDMDYPEIDIIWRSTGHPFEMRIIPPLPTDESYPQADDPPLDPVDKSEKPAMVIELEADEDLNSVATELGITLDELQCRIQAGLVRILYPLPKPPSLTAHIDWN